jgi:outer membrane protein assembly factor BamA
LRRALFGPLSAIAGYRILLQTIRTDPSSLLAREAPLGVNGSRYGEISLGLAWDTRDHEMLPRHGVLLEATARSTQRFLGSTSTAYGTFASAAVYQEILPPLVIAGRVAFDALWGDVPFDRLQDFGSLIAPFYVLNGVGGGLSVRGLLQSEYIGKTKAIANVELRCRLFQLEILGEAIALYGLAFVDAGRVWAGQDPPDLAALGIHAGGGGGLRIAWGEYFVLRADAGYAEEHVRLYADFRHIF